MQDDGKVYVGSTHQHLKKRMQRHHSDTIKMHKGQSTGSTAFARHFATQLQNFPVLTPTIIRNFIDYSVLWRGNPLSSVKTFATPHCKLCSKERTEILKRARYKPHLLINIRTGLYESCNHIPQFHRFKEGDDDSTDETQES